MSAPSHTAPATPSPARASVVSFPSRPRSVKTRHALWPSLIELSQTRFRALLEPLLTQLDDELFDASTGSSGGQVFFDALRALRKTRQALLDQALAHVADAWNRCDEPPPTPSSAEGEPVSGEMALIDNDALEEGLAVDDAIRHTEARSKEDLDALRARLAVLCGGIPVEHVNVPVAPAILIDALRSGLELAGEMTTEVKIVIYKHFDRGVLARASEIYRVLNAAMASAGILKDWRPVVPTTPRVPHVASGVPVSGIPGDAPSGGVAIPGLESVPPLHPEGATLASLGPVELQHHPAMRYFDAVPGYATAQPPDSATLWSLLHMLLSPSRGPSTARAAGPVANLADVLSAVGLVHHLRKVRPETEPVPREEQSWLDASARLKEDVRSILASEGADGSPPPALGPHEDVIDMVSLLFDFVARDEALPAVTQASLSRLQMPYLRMALMEPELFARPDHPARLLLNALSEAAKSDPASLDDATSVSIAREIDSVVERLATEHSADRHRFEEEAVAFQAFLDNAFKRTSSRERRLADAEAGRARLEEARRTVASLVRPVAEDCRLPEWLNLLLLRPWANALVLWWLRHGEDSSQYRAGKHWTLEIKGLAQMQAGPLVRTHLNQRWPTLKAVWMDGLKTASMPPEDIERWTQALQRWLAEKAHAISQAQQAAGSHSQVLEALAVKLQPVELPSTEALTVPLVPPPPSPPVVAGGQEEISANEESDRQTAPDEGFEVRPIVVGTWVERIDGDVAVRIKLVWVSPYTRRGLFVNGAGQKDCELLVSDFESLQRSGALRVIPDVPLFDRAMGSIVRRLRRDQKDDEALGSTPSAPAAVASKGSASRISSP